MKKIFCLVLLLLLPAIFGCDTLKKPSAEVTADAAKKSLPRAVQIANETPFKVKIVSLEGKGPTYSLGNMIKKQNHEGVQLEMWPLSVKASGVLEIVNDQMGFLNFRQKYRFSIEYVVYIYKNYLGNDPPYTYEVRDSVKMDSQKIDSDASKRKREEIPLPDSAAPKN